VQADRKVTVHGNESISVTKNEAQTYSADRKMTVEGTNTDAIFGAHDGTYYGGRTVEVENGDTLVVVGSHKTTTVDGEYNISANQHYSVTSTKNGTCSVDLKDGVITITAAKEIKLVCGDASLGLNSDGTVTIEGKKTLSASGAQSKLELAPLGRRFRVRTPRYPAIPRLRSAEESWSRSTDDRERACPRTALHAAILRSRSRRSWGRSSTASIAAYPQARFSPVLRRTVILWPRYASAQPVVGVRS